MQNATPKSANARNQLDAPDEEVEVYFLAVQDHLDCLARNGYYATVVAVAHDGEDRRTIKGDPNRDRHHVSLASFRSSVMH